LNPSPNDNARIIAILRDEALRPVFLTLDKLALKTISVEMRTKTVL